MMKGIFGLLRHCQGVGSLLACWGSVISFGSACFKTVVAVQDQRGILVSWCSFSLFWILKLCTIMSLVCMCLVTRQKNSLWTQGISCDKWSHWTSIRCPWCNCAVLFRLGKQVFSQWLSGILPQGLSEPELSSELKLEAHWRPRTEPRQQKCPILLYPLYTRPHNPTVNLRTLLFYTTMK